LKTQQQATNIKANCLDDVVAAIYQCREEGAAPPAEIVLSFPLEQIPNGVLKEVCSEAEALRIKLTVTGEGLRPGSALAFSA